MKLQRMPEYKYEKPAFRRNDLVEFWTHNKKQLSQGRIIIVETHYGYNDNVAYHVYTIARSGYKLHIHVGQKNIRFRLKEEKQKP